MRLRHTGAHAAALALMMTTGLTAFGSEADTARAANLTAAEQLAAAKTKADDATSMHLTLRSSGIPASANGILGADGSGMSAPSFKGILDARIGGLEATVDVVAIDTLLFLKLPFSTGFVTVDPVLFNAPDPAKLFADVGGLSSLLTSTTNPVEGKPTIQGTEVLKTITGKLPGASIAKLLNIDAAAKTFDVTYGITDPGGELRTLTVVGPFYEDATSTPVTSTYVLTLDRYGDPVVISRP